MTSRLQPNAYSCGPTALYNALKALRVRCSLRTVANLAACTREYGTDQAGLRAAALYYGLDLRTVVCHQHEFARATVRSSSPMLVCVDRDSDGPYAHWISVLRATSKHVYVADSSRPGPADRRETWRAFLARAVTVLGPGDMRYTFHPLIKR